MDRNKIDAEEERMHREERVLERLMWQKIREIFINLAFSCMAFMVAFTYNDKSSYQYQSAVSKMMTSKLPNCISYREITQAEKFWQWAKCHLAPSVRAEYWYNLEGVNKYLSDTASVMLGYPTFRQLRVKNSKY